MVKLASIEWTEAAPILIKWQPRHQFSANRGTVIIAGLFSPSLSPQLPAKCVIRLSKSMTVGAICLFFPTHLPLFTAVEVGFVIPSLISSTSLVIHQLCVHTGFWILSHLKFYCTIFSISDYVGFKEGMRQHPHQSCPPPRVSRPVPSTVVNVRVNERLTFYSTLYVV